MKQLDFYRPLDYPEGRTIKKKCNVKAHPPAPTGEIWITKKPCRRGRMERLVRPGILAKLQEKLAG
jgi:hypothetical protein